MRVLQREVGQVLTGSIFTHVARTSWSSLTKLSGMHGGPCQYFLFQTPNTIDHFSPSRHPCKLQPGVLVCGGDVASLVYMVKLW